MKQFLLMLLLLLLLLIFHKETIMGTEQGLLLWYQTLIPSLLPFILITNALSETNSYQAAAASLPKRLSTRIYELTAIVLGNLYGYPIGGKLLNGFVKDQLLSPQRARQLLALSSQASPMFLIGYVHLHILKDSIPLPVFLLSIYLPVGIGYIIKQQKQSSLSQSVSVASGLCVKDTFLNAVRIMVIIGIYVILFSILLAILLPYCQHTISRLLLSFLEITTGLQLLDSLFLSTRLKAALLCALCAFGGLCSGFQVKSVMDPSNVNIKKYLLDKTCLSAGTFFIILLYEIISDPSCNHLPFP